MTTNNDHINQLLEKLESLVKRQKGFSKEIYELREAIVKLKSQQHEAQPQVEEISPEVLPVEEVVNKSEEIPQPQIRQRHAVIPDKQTMAPYQHYPKAKSNIEKFVGENLINKIGIAITIIGVAVGVKYSIEHQLISPATRIILGYIMGLGLLFFGIRLKQKYENYSAVLVSGAIAVMYLITFAAYEFYSIIPQALAFALMVVFTSFAVVAATQYNKQVIAHIGLVGAYAVPFLLSDGSSRVGVLFTYMAIINAGILVIAFKKYWKLLSYSSFFFTVLIFTTWLIADYSMSAHFGLSLVFLLVFYVTFYTTFLAYKLVHNEKFHIPDILLLLTNSFIFFGLGYFILSGHPTGKHLLGLFSLSNAVIHFVISLIIYKKQLADKNLFFLVSGLALIFLTITIPVQLDGNWVTILWVFQASLLYWIGRTKNSPVYEKLSYPLMLLSFLSIFQQWEIVYNAYNPEMPETRLMPLFNIQFLTSALVIANFSFIYYISRSKRYSPSSDIRKDLLTAFSFGLPVMLLVLLYLSFMLEISNYWNQLYLDSATQTATNTADSSVAYMNYDLKKYKTVWLINYSMLYLSLLIFVNIKRLKNQLLGNAVLILSSVIMFIFLTQGLYELSELRESYLQQTLAEYYTRSSFNIIIRYFSFGFVALTIFSMYKCIRQDFMAPVAVGVKKSFDIMLYTTIIWVVSSEWLTWMDILKSTHSYKLGLSILWGIYALLLIVIGIWKQKKHLRVSAITLFAFTLLKLFFYDISHLSTIAKTIVLVSLGVLLLIISFLYNKYKHLISDENEK